MTGFAVRLKTRIIAVFANIVLVSTFAVAVPQPARAADPLVVGVVVALTTYGVVRHHTRYRGPLPYCGQYPDGRHRACTHPTHVLVIPAKCRVGHGEYAAGCMHKHGRLYH